MVMSRIVLSKYIKSSGRRDFAPAAAFIKCRIKT